jgi:FtsP/CotA-like multicopper oxidase with cupredoxin domain
VYDPPENDALLWRVLDETVEMGNHTIASPSVHFEPEQQVLVSENADKAAQIVINSDNMMAHPWHLQ